MERTQLPDGRTPLPEGRTPLPRGRMGAPRWEEPAWSFLSLPLLLFILLPLVAILFNVAPADLLNNLQDPVVRQAISLSLTTSLIATLLSIVFGTPVAYLLAQNRSRYHTVIDTLVDIPTVLPPAVAGVGLLMAFGRRGLFGGVLADAGISIPFTQIAVIMAQVFIASPLFIKAAAIGFSTVSAEIKQAAELDGAGPFQIFGYIMFPLTRAALLSGSVMTWARAMGEFGATIIFAGNFPGRTQTMPLAIYIGFEIDLRIALTLSMILIGFSFLTLLLVRGLFQSKVEQDRY